VYILADLNHLNHLVATSFKVKEVHNQYRKGDESDQYGNFLQSLVHELLDEKLPKSMLEFKFLSLGRNFLIRKGSDDGLA
jgi:hypothetical protein